MLAWNALALRVVVCQVERFSFMLVARGHVIAHAASHMAMQ
jgi:hypothetical protein